MLPRKATQANRRNAQSPRRHAQPVDVPRDDSDRLERSLSSGARWWRRRGGAHVDFGAEPEPGGPLLAVEIEQDALALAEQPEDRSLESVAGQVVLAPVGVANEGALAGTRVV